MSKKPISDRDNVIVPITSALARVEKRSESKEVVREKREELQRELGWAIEKLPPRFDDLWFSPVFCFQACLPHLPVEKDQVDETGAWVRKNGLMTLKVRSSKGYEYLPYGKYTRVFLMWLTNEAARKDSEIIDEQGRLSFQGSYRNFCERLNVDSSTGQRGPGRLLLDQIDRIIHCSFEITYSASHDGTRVLRERHFYVTTDLHLQWEEKILSNPADFMEKAQGGFQLSRDFVHELREHKFPVDSRVLKQLLAGRSPFRIDLYHWLSLRNFALWNHKKSQVKLRWVDLEGQFGGFYKSHYDFVHTFRREMRGLRRLWPGLMYNDGDALFFTLQQSPQPVPPTAAIKAERG